MNTAIILAAGKGSRMKAGINKQYLNLKGRPILSYTLEVFSACDAVDEIVLVIDAKEKQLCYNLVLNNMNQNKPIKIVNGGDERQQSVQRGLRKLHDSTDIIVIHDGARPFVTCEMIENCIKGANKYGAVSLGVPIKETVKTVDDEEFVINTLNREKIWITQTPQAFKRDLIVQAHDKALNDKKIATDDAMLVEYLNYNVKMIMGDYSNIKITTADDLIIAEAIIENAKTVFYGGKND